MGNETVVIRESEEYDVRSLKKLYVEMTPDYDYPVLTSRIREYKKSTNEQLYVVEVNGDVVGTLSLCLALDGVFGRSKYMVVENIVVAKKYRGKGYGREMVEYVLEKAREEDVEKVMILPLRGREEILGLLKAYGFEDESSLGMKKFL